MTFLEGLSSALGLQGWFSASNKKPMASSGASGGAADAAPEDPFFCDAAFENVLKEMENPDLTGFEKFADTHGVTIHRRPKGDSGLFEYKIAGYQPELDARVCALVNTDLGYRKKWDKYVAKLEVLKRYNNGLELLHWEVAYPFPLTNRDYFYTRRTKELSFALNDRPQTAWVTISRCSAPDPAVCPETNALRVDDFKQTMAITTHESGRGSRLYINSFDNPKGSIPTWLINYFASSGVSSYLDSVQKAVDEYQRKS